MDQVSKKGIRVGKGQSVLAAFQNAVPHWIHEKIEDPSYVGGFRYARKRLPALFCMESGQFQLTNAEISSKAIFPQPGQRSLSWPVYLCMGFPHRWHL